MSSFPSKHSKAISVQDNRPYFMSKRSMMAAGSRLTPFEVIGLKRILYHHNTLLKKEYLTQTDLLEFSQNASLINLKVFQHFIQVAYPNFSVSVYDLERAYTNIKINCHPSLKEKFSWDDIITATIGNRLAKEEFFKEGQLILPTSPVYKSNKAIDYTNSPIAKDSYQQTGQAFSDYQFKRGLLHTYYDLKAGTIKPMRGHIFVTSSSEKYEEISISLFEKQIKYFKALNDVEYSKFIFALEDIYTKPKLSWVERNIELHKFYSVNRRLLLPEMNPTLIFYIEPEYLYSEKVKIRLTRIAVDHSSCESLANTEETITNSIIIAGKMATKTYIQSPYSSSSIREN